MNPFYNRHQQNAQPGQGFDLQAALQNLMKQIPAGMTPEQIVRQKIQNGEMTQAQFEQYSQMADQFLGRRR